MISHDAHAYLDDEGNILHLIVSDADLGDVPRVMVETAAGEPMPLTLERLELAADRRLDASELFPHLERAPGPAGGLRWKGGAPAKVRVIGLKRRPVNPGAGGP